MYKLDTLQYPAVVKDINISKEYSNYTLKNNKQIEELVLSFKNKFNFKNLNTMSFTQEAFLGLMCILNGKIAISIGESDAIIQAGYQYKNLGLQLDFISLNKDGSLKYDDIKKDLDYIFISSYIMDTYVKVDLQKVSKLTKAKIISNISATLDCSNSDIVIFDSYKLTAYATSCIILHNNLLPKQSLAQMDIVSIKNIYDSFLKEIQYTNKSYFIKYLKQYLKDDLFFFVQADTTLTNTLHFALKNIKARQLIRTLALGNIFMSNGEGCSLGLLKPSRILQEMGYSELESRQAISLSYTNEFREKDIEFICKKISKTYRQIKALND